MKIVHFCADLSPWNGMANTARQFVAEELVRGHESMLTDDLAELRRRLASSSRSRGRSRHDGVEAPSPSAMRLHVHGTWLPVLWRATKLAKRCGAEVVVHPHGNYDPLRRRQGTWKRFKKWAVGPWERAMLRRADVIQATCEAEAGWIREYLGEKGNIQITDLKRFFKIGGMGDRVCDAITRSEEGHEGTVKEVLRREMGALHVLFLGRAEDPLKGVRFLERAVAELNGNGERGEGATCGARTRRCGRHEGTEKVLRSAEQIELRIVRNHKGEELERDWEWCDVLCLPTLSENFGLVVAEALERGKRVITTDGAPAWEPGGGCGKEVDDGGLLVYLRGFRNGSDAERVRLLKEALV